MKLQFSGAPEVHATRERVWQALLDPHFVGASAPGVETITVLDAEQYDLHLAIGVAFLKLHIVMHVRMHDLVPEERAQLTATGMAAGTEVTVHSSIAIKPLAPERQQLAWSAEGEVQGALANLGARMLEGVVRSFTEDFWEDFAKRVSAEHGT
jgi:carbon monoxide dehydrogenase subunit G